MIEQVPEVALTVEVPKGEIFDQDVRAEEIEEIIEEVPEVAQGRIVKVPIS
jgi:hypothetical protein